MRTLLILLCCSITLSAFSQSGYKIDIKLANYKYDTLLLGYYMGDKQFVKDTAISKTGNFTFKSSKDLDPGVYMAVLLPQKMSFSFLLIKTIDFLPLKLMLPD
ncbi:MAG: DUF4369 domain-containing protein [Saprospiraceae bacterium]|nr:DUF4369 domain-containing protein [Candidatus Brachybacter algidus]